MSREIRFRVWDKVQSSMVYPSPTDSSGGLLMTLEGAVYSVGKYMNDHIELQQYTGLKDKNGVEIYEGDIIRDRFVSQPGFGQIGFGSSFDREWIAEVKIPDVYMCWDAHQFPDPETLAKHFAEGDDKYGVEVIGNIYENKELLNDQSNT